MVRVYYRQGGKGNSASCVVRRACCAKTIRITQYALRVTQYENMRIDLDKDDLKQGVLGLVMAIVEVIRDTLQSQAVKRMEGGTLTPEQIEKLGKALIELDHAIEMIKDEHNIKNVVGDVHKQLDNLVGDVVEALVEPVRHVDKEARRQGNKEARI